MNKINLRKKPRVSYYEPEEPALDEYVYCADCSDYMYEYCSIHGPLLVIPDDEVPANTGLPSYVPRSALTIPHVFLHLAPSIIPGAGLGVFTTLTLPRGVRFGPYRGKRTQLVESSYCWQIYDRDNKPSHAVDASDANSSNWMRYVNCSRHWCEQNLVAYQYCGEIYYRTIKVIPRFTELMVFYGSEFADFLQIDLRNYNSPSRYEQKLGAPLVKKAQKDIEKGNLNEKKIIKNIEASSKPQAKIDANTTTPIIQTTPKIVNTKRNTGKNDLKTIIINKEKQIAGKSTQNDKNNNLNKENLNVSVNVDGNIIGKNVPNEQPMDKNLKLDLYHYCGKCNNRFITRDFLEKHSRFHDVTRHFVCDICGFRFTSKKILQNHITCHNRNKSQQSNRFIGKFACNECSYTSDYKRSMKIHLRKHTGEKPFSCHVCKYKCARKNDLTKHMRTHTGEKPFSCHVCKYKCAHKINLKVHMRTHTGEKPFSCHVCKYICARKNDLTKHMRTHTGEKPFSCHVCKYKCAQKINLNVHMRTHTGEKPFSCHICNYKCAQKISLNRHMRTHTGEKPFSCHVCKYKCARKNDLTKHMRTHTGEKPFSCHVCKYKCAQKISLNVHMRTHTGEKPFSCHVCKYKCAQKISLNVHMRTHTGEKPFSCHICNYKYTRKCNLNTHIRRIHK